MAPCLPQEQVAFSAQTHWSERPQQVVGLTIFANLQELSVADGVVVFGRIVVDDYGAGGGCDGKEREGRSGRERWWWWLI